MSPATVIHRLKLGALATFLGLAACTADTVPTTAPPTTEPPTTSTSVVATTTADTLTTTSTTVPTTTTTTEPLPELLGLELEVVSQELDQPVLLVAMPGTERLFVVERGGTVEEMTVDGVLGESPWLDLRDRVNSGGIEQGLLGMAFHPDFGVNGRVFAFYYYGELTTRLVEYSADPTGAVDPGTERVLISFDKPTVRHNGGMVEFGPDGMLYLGLGEGGKASVHSQDPSTLLASILRIDVDSGDPYGIPPDNPFVGGGGAPEVWAYGLRNPWRFSIDDGWIYIGDVGQEDIEEIDVVSLADGGGTNFGWIRMEGTQCFQRGCDAEEEGLTLPVLEFGHDEGCSVTGGRVYRGTAIPELIGTYFYSDWCGQFLRSFRWNGTEAMEQTEWLTGIGQVNSFGTDAAGELYILTHDGTVARIAPTRAER